MLLGAAFRLQGFAHGLPYALNADEWLYLKRGLKVAQTGDPEWYQQSAATTHLLLGATYRLMWGAHRLVGGTEEFGRWASRPPTRLRLLEAGRIACAATDLVTILLVFVLARRLGRGRREALAASLLYASSCTAIGLAHLIRVDLQLVLGFVACALFSIGLARRRRPVDYVLTGLAAGLTFATKWPAGIALLWLPLAHLASDPAPRPALSRRRAWAFALAAATVAIGLIIAAGTLDLSHIRQLDAKPDKVITPDCVWFVGKNLFALGLALALAGLLLPFHRRFDSLVASLASSPRFGLGLIAFVAGFFAGAPFAAGRWRLVVVGILCEARTSRPPFEGTPLENLVFYLTRPLAWDLTLVGLALAAVGIVWLIKENDRDERLVLCVPLLYFAYLCFGPLHWEHYVAPVCPFLALLAARGLTFLVERISCRHVGLTLAALACVPALTQAWSLSKSYTLRHTGILATRWIEDRAREARPGRPVRVLQDCYDVEYFQGNPDTTFVFSIEAVEPQFLTTATFDYLVTSTATSDGFFRRADRYPIAAARYRELFESWKPTAVFAPDGARTTGPTIRIYALPDPRPARLPGPAEGAVRTAGP